MPLPFLAKIAVAVLLTLVKAALNAQNIEVGKVDDPNLDSGSYGEDIPRVYGRQTVRGKTIWIANNKLYERKKKKKILFGIGGSVKTYSYFGSFAMALTSNEVKLKRIWANDTLIFDAYGGGVDFEDDVYVEFRNGADSQALLATIAVVDGVGTDGLDAMQDYGGVSIVAFHKLPLEKFGNSIPQIECEVENLDPAATITYTSTNSLGTVSSTPSVDKYGRGIWYDDSIDSVRIVDLETGVAEVTIPINAADVFAYQGDGTVEYLEDQRAIIGGRGVVIDIATGERIVPAFDDGVFGGCIYSTVCGNTFIHIDQTTTLRVMNTDGSGLISADLDGFGDDGVYPSGSGNFRFVCYKTNGILGGIYNIGSARYFTVLQGVTTVLVNVDISSYGFTSNGSSIGYVHQLDAFIIVGDGGILKIDVNGTVIDHWDDETFQTNDGATRSLTKYDLNTFWVVTDGASTGDLLQFGLASMEVLSRKTRSEIGTVFLRDAITLPTSTNLLLNLSLDNNNNWRYTYVNETVPDSTITVRSIIEDLSESIGFPASQLDATAGSRTIGGFTAGSETVRTAIQDLIKVTGYDLVEENGKITLKDRGTPSVATILTEHMGADEDDGDVEYLQRTIIETSTLPERLELNFADVDGDFSNNMVYARQPEGSTVTGQTANVSTPIALKAEQAKTFAQNLLSQMWRAREIVAFSVPFKRYPMLNATDIITVPDGDTGDVLQVAITKISGFNVLTIQGVIDDPTGADSIVAYTGLTLPVQTLVLPGDPILVILDTALPSDTVDFQQGLGFYAETIPQGRNVGDVDYSMSDDAIVYDVVGENDAEGIAVDNTGTLSIDADASVLDVGSTITIKTSETLTTSTVDALLSDPLRNLLFVQSGTDYELIQFATVTDNLDGTLTLTDLMRGRRGTEFLIAGHDALDRVVCYNPAYARGADITDYDVQRSYAVSRDEFDTPDIQEYTSAANGLRPYSVTDIEFEASGADAVINWTRRTRIGGSDIDGGDVPLSETSEAYDIEILDDLDAVVRTVSGHGSQSYTYTAADQTTDLGGANIAFTAVIYQVSDEVGRGVSNSALYANGS